MAEDALEIVKSRNTFYRDNFRNVVIILSLSIMLNIILIFAVGYLYQLRPAPEYFATTADGRVIALVPLSKPNLSQQELLQWSVRAARAAYTYNFVNYRKALQDASSYFTPGGWREFLKGLEASRNLKAVEAKKLVVSAVPTGAPTILQQGPIRGRYAWKVRLPILVTYQSADTQIQQSLLITMLVIRIPMLNAPKGIGIAQFVAQGT